MSSEKFVSKLPEETQKTIREATKLGKKEYAKLKKEKQKHLRETADEFLDAIRERVDSIVILGDVDALGRLVEQVKILGSFEVLHALREKGFDKEITALCDKAGATSGRVMPKLSLIGKTAIDNSKKSSDPK